MTVPTLTSSPGPRGEGARLDAAALAGASLVGGEPVAGEPGAIQAVDPRSGRQLAPAYGAVGADVVDRASELAWEAFGSYRATSPAERAAFLETIADSIAALGPVLHERVVAETGIPLARVQGESARTVNQLRLFASVLLEGSWHDARLDSALPDRTPLPRPDIRLRTVPVGPVAVFGASNFPLAFSVGGGDTASALAAGSPVVVKAHSSHPGTSELVGRAISNAVAAHGLHPGVFSLLFGSGRAVGIPLVTHPRIAAVGFTGSRSGGLALVAAAAARPVPIPVYAEMSSLNPVFVLPGALGRSATSLAEGWVASVATGFGQLCTSPGLVFVVDGPDADAFASAAASAIAGVDGGPMLSDGIAEAFASGISSLSSLDGVSAVGSGPEAEAVAIGGSARLFRTDVERFRAMPELREEVFGPAAVIVTVPGVEELVGILNDLEGQLTVTVHSDGAEPGAAALLEAAELRAGRVIFNGWPTGVEVGHAMVHGGPFPSTSNNQATSVGTRAIERFLRPVSYQNVPAELLPPVLRDDNPLGVWRRRDGVLKKD